MPLRLSHWVDATRTVQLGRRHYDYHTGSTPLRLSRWDWDDVCLRWHPSETHAATTAVQMQYLWDLPQYHTPVSSLREASSLLKLKKQSENETVVWFPGVSASKFSSAVIE